MTGAAFPVASLIKRKQNFGNEAPAFTQHRLYHVGRSAFETRQVRITLELQDVVEHELRIPQGRGIRSEEHTSELQSLMRISYAVFCLKKKKKHNTNTKTNTIT